MAAVLGEWRWVDGGVWSRGWDWNLHHHEAAVIQGLRSSDTGDPVPEEATGAFRCSGESCPVSVAVAVCVSRLSP